LNGNISIYISVISLIISIIVSWNSWWKSRPNIKVEKFIDSADSVFIKTFDGCLEASSEQNKVLPSYVSVILADIILTNKSSEPISILEFSIPDFPVFNSYSNTKDSFTVTTAENSKMIIGKDSPIKYLKPEVTIGPYTSLRGYIFFWSGLERDLDISKDITLTIKTSRKNFEEKIKINGKYDSIKKYG